MWLWQLRLLSFLAIKKKKKTRVVCASRAFVWLRTASDCMASASQGSSIESAWEEYYCIVIELKLDDDRVVSVWGFSRYRPGAGM